MPQLKTFLQDLAVNADLKTQFDADPTACMQNYGLSQQEIDLVLEGDVEKLKEYLGEDIYTLNKNIHLGKPS